MAANPSRGSFTGIIAGRLPGRFHRRRLSFMSVVATLLWLQSSVAPAQSSEDARLSAAGAVLNEVMRDPDQAIPADLLERAHGIAIFPSVVRGGFILGARRGRGVLVVRSQDGNWTNPAFVTLTSGSIGWQAGAQSADVILVFANERSVLNIASGRFTLGGDASVVAGPVGRHATAAATFRAEVYAYQRSRGLFAGAAFEGVRLGIDQEAADRYYGAGSASGALAAPNASTPDSAALFLRSLERAERGNGGAAGSSASRSAEPTGNHNASGAIIYPLDD